MKSTICNSASRLAQFWMVLPCRSRDATAREPTTSSPKNKKSRRNRRCDAERGGPAGANKGEGNSQNGQNGDEGEKQNGQSGDQGEKKTVKR